MNENQKNFILTMGFVIELCGVMYASTLFFVNFQRWDILAITVAFILLSVLVMAKMINNWKRALWVSGTVILMNLFVIVIWLRFPHLFPL